MIQQHVEYLTSPFGPIERWVYRAIVVVCSAIISVPFIVADGPQTERYFFPVLLDVEVTGIRRDGNDIYWRVAAKKARACPPISVSRVVTFTSPDGDENQAAITVERIGVGTADNDAPRADADVAPLSRKFRATLTGNAALADDAVISTLIYFRCHPLWLTPSGFGLVPVPAP